MSLNRRAFILLILSLLIPISLFSWHIYDQHKHSRLELLQAKMLHNLDSIGEQLNHRLLDTLQDLELITHSPSVQHHLHTPSTALKKRIEVILQNRLNIAKTDAYFVLHSLTNNTSTFIGKSSNTNRNQQAEQQVLTQLADGKQHVLKMIRAENNQRWALIALAITDDTNDSASTLGYLIFSAHIGRLIEKLARETQNQSETIMMIDVDGLIINTSSAFNLEQLSPEIVSRLVDLDINQPLWKQQFNIANKDYLAQVRNLSEYDNGKLLIGLYPKAIIQADFTAFARQLVIYSGLLTLILVLAIYRLVNSELISPVNQLLKATDGIIQGQYYFKASNNHSGVLAGLEHRFEQMSQSLLENTTELKRLAFYDKLTNFPNRTSFNRDLHGLINDISGTAYQFGLMYLDLDGFKNINDSYGHEVGDQILTSVAWRIEEAIQAPGFFPQHKLASLPRPKCYRLGGDEFTFIFAINNDTVAESSLHAYKVLSLFKELFSDGQGKFFNLGVSIGIAAFPSHGNSYSSLLKNADIAMYHTKENSKNGYSLFKPEMSQEVYRLMQLREALPHAVRLEQLSLNFQPIMHTNQSLMGFEALLRWRLNGHSISPATFIPIAEETGHIIEIGAWVIEHAIRQVHDFNQQGFRLNCTINLSMVQLEHSDLLQQLAIIMNRYLIDPRQICFEVTESIFMGTTSRAKNQLQRLRAMDFNIAIDDFGTGYSSLERIRSLPISVLKIDQSFIIELDKSKVNLAIVRATIAMAKALNLEIIAEGVEDKAYIEQLTELGCDYLQGYALSKPLTADDLAVFIKQHAHQPLQLSSVS